MPRQSLPAGQPLVGIAQANKAGNMLFVSGQVATDEAGKTVGAGDAAAQAKQVFKNLEAALGLGGAKLTDVVKITCFLTRAEDFAAYRAARQAAFPLNPPASSTVIVKALVSPEYLLEVEAIAVVG